MRSRFQASVIGGGLLTIAAEPTGAIYVAVDEQGSLGRTPGGGKILRCVDRDGDGKVDEVTVFAKVDHPRGVCNSGPTDLPRID